MKVGLANLPLHEVLGLYSSGSVTQRDLLESNFDRIRRLDRELNSFITVFWEKESLKSPPKKGVLGGITVSLKDNIYASGKLTTAGSKILRRFKPAYDATLMKRLLSAGAIPVGKTNLHEFAFGVTNENPHFGACRNPWRKDRMSGGSSGGSAVSVASGMCCVSIGTDTAGSVRIPASLNGVVGYKPTYGMISRHGVIPLSWSLDTVGFLTRCVRDAAVLASVTFGVDGSDFLKIGAFKGRGLKRLRIGVPRNQLDPIDDDVRKNFEESLNRAEGEGARSIRIYIDNLDAVNAARNIIVHAEAASYHQPYIQKRLHDYGQDVRDRLLRGLMIPAMTYLAAQRARRKLCTAFRAVFKEVDALALPTTPIPAPPIGANLVKVGDSMMDTRAALLRFTQPFNLFGVPAISLPCGSTREKLPVGLQLVGDMRQDQKLLAIALSFEKILPQTETPPK
ncbi:MAG: amidase [Thaumarchaeota archaeon]|nr:amidase [Nitrososphaerota archaeon]